MQRQLLPCPLLPGSVAVTMATLALVLMAADARADVRYEWEQVPGASFYEGTARHDRDITVFRTDDHWLMLPEQTEIEVHAVRDGGEADRPLPVHSSPAAPKPAPKPAAKQAARPAKPYLPDAADAAADDQVLADVLEPRENSKDQLEPVGLKPRRFVVVSVGAGREWLKASGGTSQFAAAPGIGATLLKGQWQPQAASWYLDAEGEAHNLQASTALETPSGAQVGNASSKFLRAAARGAVFYDFNGAGSGRATRFAAGVGLSYERMPMLLIAKSGTTAATLQDRHAVGPYFVLSGELQVMPNSRFGGTAGLLPTTFTGPLKALSLNASTYWQQSFTTTFFSELGGDLRRTYMSQQADCPALDSCHDVSTANSNLFLLHVGIGLNI